MPNSAYIPPLAWPFCRSSHKYSVSAYDISQGIYAQPMIPKNSLKKKRLGFDVRTSKELNDTPLKELLPIPLL